MKLTDDEKKYEKSINRMINRWAGKKLEYERNFPDIETIDARDEILTGKAEGSRVLEPAREIPVLDRCDVLVVGGGPAGLSAALSAKRAGADTILMERYGCFGGTITTVGMETLGWYRYEGTVESDGIGMEMEKLAAKLGGTVKWPYNDSECLDADFFKVVADRLITESGVRPILHCLAVEAVLEDGKITGVVTESKSGRMAVLAERVIDCTGDADIAYLCGAPFRTNPVKERQNVTTVFNCSGVDKEKFLKYTEENPATYADWSRVWNQETTGKEDSLRSPYLDTEFVKAKELGVIPQDSLNFGGSWSALTDAGEATNLNLVHMKGFDCTDVNDLTKAEMMGRREALNALKALKKIVPGFENAKLRNFGMTLGCRDSRKIIGRYNLTGDDVRNQAEFEDSIGIFPEFIDGYNILILPSTGRYFEVPYGCMVPHEVDNLLVAGRCISGDKISHAAMRNMMACTITGQGAGIAAAVSVRTGKTTSSVDVNKVQEEVLKQGVRIH